VYTGGVSVPFALPARDGFLLQRRDAARAAFIQLGWRLYATPITEDAERRRLLNIDLTEPDLAWWRMGPDGAGEMIAVASFEADLRGEVTHLELTAVEPVEPQRLADQLIAGAGEPKVSGGAEAREWVWGPESGSAVRSGNEPLRLWVCAERAYGDRLWAVLSVVRRSSASPEE
jgi:hypothetical protein